MARQTDSTSLQKWGASFEGKILEAHQLFITYNLHHYSLVPEFTMHHFASRRHKSLYPSASLTRGARTDHEHRLQCSATLVLYVSQSLLPTTKNNLMKVLHTRSGEYTMCLRTNMHYHLTWLNAHRPTFDRLTSSSMLTNLADVFYSERLEQHCLKLVSLKPFHSSPTEHNAHLL